MRTLFTFLVIILFTACGPSRIPNGILLNGNSDTKAADAVFNYELEHEKDGIPEKDLCTVSGTPAPSPVCVDKHNRVVLTKFEIAFAENTTVGQINTLLRKYNARITSMVRGVNLLVVRINRPDKGLPELLEILKRVEKHDFVLYATKAYLYHAHENLSQENERLDGDLAENLAEFNDHHLAIRASSAWNAKSALRYKSSSPPLVVIMDFFGDGPPNHDFACNCNTRDFSSDNSFSHGYHVLGTIAGRHQEKNTRRGVVRGIYPDTLDVRVVDLMSGIDSLTATHRLIKILRSEAGRNIVLNTSLQTGCKRTLSDSEPSDCLTRMMPYARRWLQLIRGWEIYRSGKSGAGRQRKYNLENKVLHLTSAGNVNADFGKAPEEYDASLASPYASARLRKDLSTIDNVVLQPAQNTLVIENRINSSGYKNDGAEKDVYVPGGLLQHCPIPESCDLVFGCDYFAASRCNGDLSAVGTNVWSMEGSHRGAGNDSGSSMSTSQVSGLAAYIWALKPELTPQQVMRLLLVTAVDSVHTDKRYSEINCHHPLENPKPVVDAYAAVLAVDSPEALTSRGSISAAPVRLAILDVNDDNAFDEKDLLSFIDHFKIAQGYIEYNSRFDLNGDGRTGGNYTANFNLDIDPFFTFDPDISVKINGTLHHFSEQSATDLDILKYYAYSPLYTGDKRFRDYYIAMAETPD